MRQHLVTNRFPRLSISLCFSLYFIGNVDSVLKAISIEILIIFVKIRVFLLHNWNLIFVDNAIDFWELIRLSKTEQKKREWQKNKNFQIG